MYKSLKTNQPEVSFTTVYNTLELLTKIGEINKLILDFERAHYNPDVRQHYHAICTGCGIISDIEQSFDLSIDKIKVHKFSQLTEFHIDFFGIYEKCADLSKKEKQVKKPAFYSA
ncbi:MAG: transcriptional repressor [Deltaproteobacteria bacterium]|nr:transcriptional repressor [Deltaproteobacteria bacterium]MCL5792987.1 transcriptional repressor [Deltaproteobacteria bacterium]